MRNPLRALAPRRPGAVLESLGHHTDLSAGVAQAVAASRQVISSGVRVLLGFSIAETTGSANALVRLHDGTSTAGGLISTVRLLAGESVRDWFADESIEVTTGAIYLEVVSGSVEGTVYWA